MNATSKVSIQEPTFRHSCQVYFKLLRNFSVTLTKVNVYSYEEDIATLVRKSQQTKSNQTAELL